MLSSVCLCYTRLSFHLIFFTYPPLLFYLLLLRLLFPPPPPPPPGFLQITPEGSPQAQRRGELGGEVDVSGSFCLTTSGLDFSTQEMSEEHQVSSTEEASVTMVTKTTRITRQMVTTETRTGESSSTTSTTTRQVTDF